MPTITKEKTQKFVGTFGKNDKDSGNVRVQIAILTEKIKNLTEHLKKNKKDLHSTRGLTIMVSERKTHLKFLQKKDLEGYRQLIKDLGLRG